MRIYAGVGARDAPPHIIAMMRALGRAFARKGDVLYTGAAIGADQAFAEGAITAGGTVHLFLPWKKYELNWIHTLVGDVIVHTVDRGDAIAYGSVDRLHPNPSALTLPTRSMHARNFNVVAPSKFIVCWTRGGVERGGTGQAIRIANELRIPVWNLGKPDVYEDFKTRLLKLGEVF